MNVLENKVALVTGATSGIGRATAHRFIEEGAFVFITGRRSAELDAAVDVRGTVFTVQKALPLLNPGASIILAGSTAATSATPAFGVYAASKAAIRSFGRTWATELADRKIRVNVIVPGPTDTDGLRGLAPDAAQADGLVKQLGAGVPMGRVAHPDEIADAVLFLASDQSSYVTGSELFADGGEEQQ